MGNLVRTEDRPMGFVEAAADRFHFNYRHVDPSNHDFDSCRTAMDRIGPVYESDVYAALVYTRGNIAATAELLNRPRSTVARWLEANPDFQTLRDELYEATLDGIEEVVHTSALAGDGANARFILTTKGKDRGYTTRAEVTGKDGAELLSVKIAEERIDKELFLRMAKEFVASVGASAAVIGSNYEEVS